MHLDKKNKKRGKHKGREVQNPRESATLIQAVN